MSNKKHLMILNQGIKAWNDWRNDNPEQKPNLEGADLREKNLTSINLIGVNLSKTNISGQNLSKINLTKANLTRANLAKTNLSGADLFMANLSRANFTEVNLSGANLSLTEALNTNFSKSIFTAACIQDWHINNMTNLNNVICEYIYLKANHQERRPHDPNRTFAQGDFTRLFQQVRETVDLIFSNGIDWKTFLTAFQKLQIESGSSELSIQAIEKKQDGALIIRVDTPINTDKEKIESSFWEKYNPLLESKDKEIKLLSQQTDFYSQQVEVIRKDNTRLLNLVETMAEKETVKVQQNFNAPVTGVAGNIQGNQNIFTSPSIAEASTEIQIRLTTLQNNGLTLEQAEEKVAKDLATQAKDNSTALGKLVNWGKSLGNKAAETSVSEVARRVIKLALNLAGVPMP